MSVMSLMKAFQRVRFMYRHLIKTGQVLSLNFLGCNTTLDFLEEFRKSHIKKERRQIVKLEPDELI